MTALVACRCDGSPRYVPDAEHGRLQVGYDSLADGILWCPAFPETPGWERRSRASLHPRPKRYRVPRLKGSPLPRTWTYSFVVFRR